MSEPQTPAPPLIRIQHLSKAYVRGGQAIPVLLDIDLSVAQGEFVALMGPSGSGKSTLLNLIAGIDKPSSGTIEIGGVDIAGLGEGALADWRAANVGFIFQFYNLLPVLSAFDNVELPLLLTRLSARERHQRVAAVLDLVGLTDRADHYPSELSGGQQQRVAIARAVVTDPLLIVADEPTGDLDRVTGAEVLTLANTAAREIRASVPEIDAQRFAAARGAMVDLELEGGERLSAKLEEIEPQAGTTVVDAALTASGGGPIAVRMAMANEGEGPRYVAPRFLAKARVTRTDLPVAGQRGRLHLPRTYVPAAQVIYERIASWFDASLRAATRART